MDWKIWLLIIIVMVYTINKSGGKQKGRSKNPAATGSHMKYANLYYKVPLLTKREQEQYRKLKKYANGRNVQICPKVRLMDLVNPKPGLKINQTLQNKVIRKHVDFVICNQDMQVLGIIELDDTTHLQQDRVERDEFVDAVLTNCDYRIIHTWNITPRDLDQAIGAEPMPQSNSGNPQYTSATGWVWNEKTKLWDPPESLKK